MSQLKQAAANQYRRADRHRGARETHVARPDQGGLDGVVEVGELAQALLQDKPRAEIVKEAIQVACVAIRVAEEGDSDFAATKTWNKAP